MAQLRFRQVRYFVAIVDAGSMTAAAQRLSLVPTALSLQIRKLEDTLGARLLDRHARGVTPTDAGRKFYRSAVKILELLDETEQLFASPREAGRRYVFGMSPSFIHVVGVGALMPNIEVESGVSIEVVEANPADLVSRLDEGEFDFVLGAIAPYTPRSDAGMVEVLEEPMVFVTSSAHHLDDSPIALEDALGKDLICIGHSPSWAAFQRLAERAGHGVEAAHVVRSNELLREMLLQDVGAAILPVSFVAPELRKGTLRARMLTGEPLTRRLSFAWSGANQRRSDDQRIGPYVHNLIEKFTRGTAPHCRLLGSFARGGHDGGRPFAT